MKHQIKNFGFTLIELLVVVAIIGLLSTIIGTGLNIARTRSRDAKRVTDMKQIKTGMDLFYSTADGYVSATTWNSTLGQKLTCGDTDFFVIPRDPANPNYTYTFSNPSGSNSANSACGTVYSKYQIIFTIERTGNSYIMDEDGKLYTNDGGNPGTPVSFDSLL